MDGWAGRARNTKHSNEIKISQNDQLKKGGVVAVATVPFPSLLFSYSILLQHAQKRAGRIVLKAEEKKSVMCSS